MPATIVSLAERPDLIDAVAYWQWQEWGRARGRRLASVQRDILPLAKQHSPEAGFVLLDGDIPAGTACLTLEDLDTRPDLSPWLASVFVDPAYRGRGHATALVRAVEQAAIARRYATLWLFTWDAAPLYARLGWHEVAHEEHHGSGVTLMRRDLSRAAPPPVAAGR